MGKPIKEKQMNKNKNKFYSNHSSFEEDLIKYEECCENDFDEKLEKEQSELYMNETAMIIRNKILVYTDTNFYPICEYLNINNVENYIKWLLV